MAKKFFYGGQAVLEGVMMRGRKTMATAVRHPDGHIAMDVRPLPSIYTGRLRRVPLIRGIIALIEAMALGIKSLMYSANVALGEDESVNGKSLWGLMFIAFALAIGLFFLVPLWLTRLINAYIPSSLVFNIIEGVVRIGIFLGYLALVRLLPDIRRVFRYHGAEHKAVNAYEHGVPLEIDHVQKYGTAHVRCGTSFLFAVMVIAVVVFTVVGRPSLWLMVSSRVLLIPLIAALGYEFTFFGANHVNNGLVRLTLVPGMLLQKLTTGEPDDRQVEVAITALKKVTEIDRQAEVASAGNESQPPNTPPSA